MEKRYIWTLWWQGEEKAPTLVKKCFESMRVHANGATVVVLDRDTVEEYVHIPEHIQEKFNQGKITVTHLSDIIRFLLLNQYGGLWIDSTVLVIKDIPLNIFEYDFYSIKHGTGGDKKNISKERWTAFILGGYAGNPVFGEISNLFSEYWKNHDELFCYFLIDFCLNEVYINSENFRKQIADLPEYVGNVFELASKIKKTSDIEKQQCRGLFQKLNWRMEEDNPIMKKINSLRKHIKNLFNIKRIKRWGFKLVWYDFLNNILRTSNSKFALYIAHKYNDATRKSRMLAKSF